jgi:hypothetical protein
LGTDAFPDSPVFRNRRIQFQRFSLLFAQLGDQAWKLWAGSFLRLASMPRMARFILASHLA